VSDMAKTRRSMADPFLSDAFHDPRLSEGQRACNVESWVRRRRKLVGAWQQRRETNAV